MRAWKKIALGAVGLFAVFVAGKFTEDSFADRGKDCVFVGGKPAERGWFQSTPSCSWSSRILQTQVTIMGVSGRAFDHAERFCKRNNGSMGFTGTNNTSVTCLFTKKT